MIDLFVIIAVILSYLIWQNSETKLLEKYLDDIQKVSEIKIGDIDSIIIKEGMPPYYHPKTLIFNKSDYKFAFVLNELSWILKRRADLISKEGSDIIAFPDYMITLKSKDGSSLREFEVWHIQLIDVQNKASYTFYMGTRIDQWFEKIPFESR